MTNQDDDYAAIRTSAGLIDRSEGGLVRVTGADRATFLQGLLTNDLVLLQPGDGCYAAYLTPQGRMISDMVVLAGTDSLLLRVPPAVRPTIAARLDSLIFSEDVSIEDLSVAWSTIGIAGPQSGRLLARALDSMGWAVEHDPATTGWIEHCHVAVIGRAENAGTEAGATGNNTGTEASATGNDVGAAGGGIRKHAGIGIVAASWEFDPTGFDVHASVGDIAALREALVGAGATAISLEVANLARIERGRPAFGIDMDEHTIPLEAGIEDRAISLTKGCYVGQEVIIRVLHRGHGRVARRLVGLTIEPDASGPIRSGAPTVARGDAITSGGRDLGHVTSTAWSPAVQRPIAMGYVHRDFAEPGTLVSVAHDGVTRAATVRHLSLL